MEISNLLPDAMGLGALVPGDATASQGAQGGDTTGSAFQGLMNQLMTEPQAEAVDVQAGQQVATEQKEEKTSDGAQSAEVIAQADVLLGSLGVIQNQPQTAVAEPTETPTTAVKAVESPQAGNITPADVPTDAKTQQAIPIKGQAALKQASTKQTESVQVNSKQVPPEPALPEDTAQLTDSTQAASSDSFAEPTPSNETDQTVKAADTAQSTVKQAKGQPAEPAVANAEPQKASEKAKTDTSAADAILDQLLSGQGSSVNQNANEQAAVQTKPDAAKVENEPTRTRTGKEEAISSAKKEPQPKGIFNLRGDSTDTTTWTTPSNAAFANGNMNNNSGFAFGRNPWSATDTSLGSNAELKAVEGTTTKDQDAAKDVTSSSSVPHWMQMTDFRTPGMNAVASTAGSNAHLPVDRAVSAKMISQIVKSAKVNMIDGGANMTLRLDPPHLGTVHMDVAVVEGSVTATLQTTTETARQALQADLTTLKQALSDAGIHVDSINVSVGGDSSQTLNSQAGSQQQFANQQRGHSQQRNIPGFVNSAIFESAPATKTTSASGVDYFA